MVITYHGGEAFKVVFGDTTLAFNPVSKDSKLKSARFGADIALVSLNHPDMNGVEQVTHGEKKPFVISGPGEYETQGIFVRGFKSSSTHGGDERLNTIYTVSLEGMNLCFLGALDSTKLSGDAKEKLENIDVLFVPVGDDGVLSPKEAHDVSVELEPKIVIPMHADDSKKLKDFLKEEGERNGKAIDKLTLKRRDLEGKEGEVIVLSA
jgi:hypothetical protein|tara:strand:- start:2636 stop:3259 length:624 start_codon:yes stop_codon:yes gene_type:complete